MSPLLIKAAPYAGISLLLLIGKCGYDAKQREIGALSERLRYTSDSLKVVTARGRQLVVQYHTDTAALREELARWQKIKQRVRTVIDTLPPLTVPGPERIVVRDSTRPPTLAEILDAADATIQRCTTALGTCERRIENLREQLVLTTTQRDAYRRLQPSGFQTVTRTLTTAAIAAGITYLIVRPK